MSFLKTIASVLGVTDAEPTEATVEAAARMVVQDAQSMKEAMSTMAQTVKADSVTPAGLVKAVQSVAARAEHFENAARKLEERDVKGAAAK